MGPGGRRRRRRCIPNVPRWSGEGTTAFFALVMTLNMAISSSCNRFDCPFIGILVVFRGSLSTSPRIDKPKNLPWPPFLHQKQPKRHKSNYYDREYRCSSRQGDDEDGDGHRDLKDRVDMNRNVGGFVARLHICTCICICVCVGIICIQICLALLCQSRGKGG